MNKERLLKNIIDQMKEIQIKLGYDKGTIRLYYPTESLNAILGTGCQNEKEMLNLLNKNFIEESVLGHLEFTVRGGRIEICIPPQGSEYVHQNVEDPAFLIDMINLFRNNHQCTLEDICQVFEKYSSDYVCEKTPEGMEFDYTMYFKNNNIDEYYYCIKMEMGHMIYHRFTKEDYKILVEA